MSEVEPEGSLVPCVSAGLLLGDVVASHTSLKGAGDAILHPLIDEFLRTMPVEHREMFRFNCAEAALVSNALTEHEQALGRPLEWADAVELCSGATIFMTAVRDALDPEHGAAVEPCKSCTRLLSALGIEVLAA